MKYKVLDTCTGEDITSKFNWVITPDGELRFNDFGDLIGYPDAMYFTTERVEETEPYKWKSVGDRLPEENIRVLVCVTESIHSYARIDTDRVLKGRWVRWGTSVTHWMQLPELPK